MAIDLKVDGIEQVLARIEGARTRSRDMRPVLQVAAEEIRTFVDDRFRSETDPSGNPWEPLSPFTLASRRGGSARILTDTGQMRNSISATGNNNTLSVGTNVPYASYHQQGTGRMPQRRFLPFSEDGTALDESGPAGQMWDSIRDQIRRYIVGD